MKKTFIGGNIFLFLIFFCFPSKNNYSQSVYGGVKVGSSSINSQTPEERGWKLNENLLSNYQIIIGLSASKNVDFYIRGGYSFASKTYKGYEVGLFYNHHLISFISGYAGLQFHFNETIGHNSLLLGKTIKIFVLGVSFEVAKPLNIELDYGYPLDKEYAYFETCDENCTKYKVYGIIKLGLKMEFNLYSLE